MMDIHDIEVVVFDVLGTLVDEPGGLRAALPDGELVALWQEHVETEQQRIADGLRPYANSEVIDREAAELVADRAGLTDPAAIARLATAGQHLPPWPDSVEGLERLARRFPVIGLSNASRTALLRISAHAGLRWHTALSGETVQAYKPAPAIYRLAIDTAGCPPERVLMVATHAWDLRGAQAAGMRTAYVERPAGDPPADTDAFDAYFGGLGELVTASGIPESAPSGR
ncbi:haloacid dehalogenase type II [Amycolatopsis lurida]